jgi:hypothetical protein
MNYENVQDVLNQLPIEGPFRVEELAVLTDFQLLMLCEREQANGNLPQDMMTTTRLEQVRALLDVWFNASKAEPEAVAQPRARAAQPRAAQRRGPRYEESEAKFVQEAIQLTRSQQRTASVSAEVYNEYLKTKEDSEDSTTQVY